MKEFTMKKFNPAHAQAIMELLADSPFYNTIHMNITDISEGYARLELEVTKEHHNPFGGIHGGVLATLLDTTTYWALYANAPEDQGYVTLDLLLNDLHSTHEGLVICEAHAVNEGHHILLSEGTIKTAEGRLLAFATSKCYGSSAIEPVTKALHALDPTITLPPKFVEG